MSNIISNLAYVSPEAVIGDNVEIQPFVFIDRNVEIGDNCVIRPHASILSGARIGKGNTIFEGAVISASPQDFRWNGEDSLVVIGDNNVIREHVIINRSIHPNGETRIGNNSFVMAQTHIGHDSSIGDYCVLGNAVKIAGNVKIGNCAILSSGALVHEGFEVGNWVLIKGGCRVKGHVPPYSVMAHNPITYGGVNAYIMRKGKYSEDTIDDIAKCYRHLYQSNTSVYNALRRIEADVDPSAERDDIVNFVRSHNLKIAAVPIENIIDR